MQEVKIAIGDKIMVKLADLHEFQGDLKELMDEDYETAKRSILELEFSFCPHVWRSKGKLYILDGHQRTRTLRKMEVEGYKIPDIPVIDVRANGIKQAKKKVLAAASQYGRMTPEGLYQFAEDAQIKVSEIAEIARFPEVDLVTFEENFYTDPKGLGSSGGEAGPPITLADRFLVPPFSVLDARAGYWQERKDKWLALGIQSEVGRGGSPALLKAHVVPSKQKQHVDGVLMKSDSGNDPAYYFKKQAAEKKLGRTLTTEEFQEKYYEGPDTYESGTSIFDPVLCEIAYRWFCPKGGLVLDPFAGGSVRGVIAHKLERRYVGIELRKEQVDANRKQGKDLCKGDEPTWLMGDSLQMESLLPKKLQADFIFSCPPYADLEVYSKDPADLSNMPYKKFRDIYAHIIELSVARLKSDRFACFVVGEVRDKTGAYYGFVQDTIAAFKDAGARLYNEAILVTSVGSLAIRAGKPFQATRKLGKSHQNVLVFVKGDPKKAAQNCGDVEVAFPGDPDPAASVYGEELS